jgi:hypothetical protein
MITPRGQWHPAMYVAAGTLFGVEGVAMHVEGDTWRFAYTVGRGSLGPRYREVDVFRTAVDVRPSLRARS